MKYITRMPGKPAYRYITIPKCDPDMTQSSGDRWNNQSNLHDSSPTLDFFYMNTIVFAEP